jgi:cytochrome c oxidase assembly protein subunit 15
MAHVAATRENDFGRANDERRPLRIWLGLVVLALFALVIVGGATRLTQSGLSITEWKPIHGVIPPLDEQQWQEEFDLYKRIPQYQMLNSDMTLEGFKSIYWWEWAHRLLARSIGVLFFLPFLYFVARGKIEKRLRLPLLGIFLLGGLQGAIGWWMVASGLTELTSVSQYRLAVHLVMACLIFSSTVWIMRGLSPHSGDVAPRGGAVFAGIIAAMALFQIYLGALVAGLHAGMTYNTWPLMDGAIIPGDLFVQKPWWINLFENPKTVQFVHRCGAYALFVAVIAQAIWLFRVARGTTHCRRAMVLVLLVTIQAGLGIAALLTQADLHAALTHQAGALVVLGFTVAHWRGFIGEYPREAAARKTSASNS